jgi:4-amino-4-deoxy-L-arabinose transferase-like glycosyltransferase
MTSRSLVSDYDAGTERSIAPRSRGSRRLEALALVALLALGLALQLRFLSRYPQPILFGDAAGYYSVGQRIQKAVATAGESPRRAFESIRPYLYFSGPGVFYAVIERATGGGIGRFRVALVVFNVLAMLGSYLLAREIFGSRAGGLIALALAALYPSFAAQVGRLLPDPITGCFFVGSAALFAYGVRRTRRAALAAAGASLGVALLVRSQLIEYVLGLLLVLLAAALPRLRRDPRARASAAALLAGLAPFALAWLAIGAAVGSDLRAVEQLGNFTFGSRYPYGFWQFLDSDGWMGPYPLGSEPYYQELQAAAAKEPELLASRPRQILFTAGYVARRWDESALLVLDNAYRLYSRPANDYKWDYPFAYRQQVLLQGVIVGLSAVGAGLLAAETPALSLVLFIPAALLLLHGLAYPWPRFNLPAMPILIAVAGATLWRLARVRGRPAPAALLCVATGLAAGTSREWSLRLGWPGVARVAAPLCLVLMLAGVWLLTRMAATRRGNVAAAVAVALLGVPAAAHLARDRGWHELRTELGQGQALEQLIRLEGPACDRLRAASEAFVVADLEAPAPEVDVFVNGVSAGRLLPTMARFGESVAAGGRDVRQYPQWWAAPLSPRRLGASGACEIRVRLEPRGPRPLSIRADRFGEQDRVFEGPSFGDWPHVSAVKLEHDGDARLPVRRALGSAQTLSFEDRDGQRLRVSGVPRVRVVTLLRNEGRLVWRTPELPRGKPAALAFFAYAGARGEAELLVDGTLELAFPLDGSRDFSLRGPRLSLCHLALPQRGGMAYGVYVLGVPPERAGGALELTVRFRSGMSIEPMFFSVNPRVPWPPREPLGACAPTEPLLPGVAAIVDARSNGYPESTGRWGVAEVF